MLMGMHLLQMFYSIKIYFNRIKELRFPWFLLIKDCRDLKYGLLFKLLVNVMFNRSIITMTNLL